MAETTRLSAGQLERKADRDEERIDRLLKEVIRKSRRKIG